MNSTPKDDQGLARIQRRNRGRSQTTLNNNICVYKKSSPKMMACCHFTSKNNKIFFKTVHFGVKIYLILNPSVKNFTTGITSLETYPNFSNISLPVFGTLVKITISLFPASSVLFGTCCTKAQYVI